MDNIQKLIARVPVIILAALYCGWLAYDYYDWLNSPTSELGVKKASVVTAKADLEQQKKKLAAGEDFFKNLDSIRNRIRTLSAQLDATKTSLSADIDIANFVRMITLEVKKLGIVMKGIKPQSEAKREFYTEVPFKIDLSGAYVQLLVLFDRIAKFQQIIRISDFAMKPSGNIFTKYVELEGSVTLVTYRYIGSAADEVLKKDTMKGKEREAWAK